MKVCAFLGASLCLFLPLAALLTPVTSNAGQDSKCPSNAGFEMTAPTDTDLRIRLRLEPSRIPVSTPFKADITICGERGAALKGVRLDATMPAHGHGMNYEASLKKITEQHYVVDQLLFHMPGVWRFEVSVRQGPRTLRFVHSATVE